jgi:ABC-type antimicrobial peptide transport system permease subunit
LAAVPYQGGVMKGFLKYLVLPALVLGLLANAKDIKRYLRIRNM